MRFHASPEFPFYIRDYDTMYRVGERKETHATTPRRRAASHSAPRSPSRTSLRLLGWDLAGFGNRRRRACVSRGVAGALGVWFHGNQQTHNGRRSCCPQLSDNKSVYVVVTFANDNNIKHGFYPMISTRLYILHSHQLWSWSSSLLVTHDNDQRTKWIPTIR